MQEVRGVFGACMMTMMTTMTGIVGSLEAGRRRRRRRGGGRVSGWVGVALVHIAFGVGLRAYVLGALFR